MYNIPFCLIIDLIYTYLVARTSANINPPGNKNQILNVFQSLEQLDQSTDLFAEVEKIIMDWSSDRASGHCTQ